MAGSESMKQKLPTKIPTSPKTVEGLLCMPPTTRTVENSPEESMCVLTQQWPLYARGKCSLNLKDKE